MAESSIHLAEARRVFQAEAEALLQASATLTEAFAAAVDLILASTGKVIIAGIGKSGIIGHKMAATLASTGTSAISLNAGEALHGDLGVVAADDVVILISNSAATTELVQMLPSIKQIGAKTIGLFGATETPLARACEVLIPLIVEERACPLGLSPMTSSTVTQVMGDALASALMKARGFQPEQFALYHPGGSLGRRLLLRVRDVMHSIDGQAPVVTPEATLRRSLEVMSESNLGGIIIAQDGRVQGVFTDGDLRRVVLKGLCLDTPIADLMTAQPITVGDTMRLGEVLDTMENRQRRIYFVPVVDHDARLCGALRMHDILADNG